MTCPQCHHPTAIRGLITTGPYSGAIERMDSCPCGWWRLMFLGWADEQEKKPVQLVFNLEQEQA